MKHNEADQRLASRELNYTVRPRRHIPFRRSLLVVLALVVVGLPFMTPAHGDHTSPLVISYEPSAAYPGDRVRVSGVRFGAGFSPTGVAPAVDSVKYGTRLGSAAALGIASLIAWNDTEFWVRLPDPMPPGTYWLAIYRAGDLMSNQLVGLTVRSKSLRLAPTHPLEILFPTITGYNPRQICFVARSIAGPRVMILGRNLGSRGPDTSVKYGRGPSPMGQATILSWSETQIQVQFPPTPLESGLYWLALYRGLKPASNQLKELASGGECPAPPERATPPRRP